MCGIAGYFGIDGAGEAVLKRMNDAQAHRGPDGEGTFTEAVTGLGHRRLAIIDRAHGKEPLFTPDKNFVITYNGEVYNYKALREELEKEGCTFATDSDTEVVVQAYATWGIQAFDRFNGMFALAIYDRKAKKLVLARDHFGIKPLYFANIGDNTHPRILFASEAKALLASGHVVAKPNDRVIYRYLRFRIHDDSTETFFDGIHSLQPGHCMVITAKDGLRTEQYTQLPQELAKLGQVQKPYTDAETKQYRKAFFEAIRMRLASEVPVGTCLSGGLDSSAVTLAINKLFYEHDASADAVGAVQNTFSAVFPGSINDEEKYADAVVDVCKGDVAMYKVYPNADEFRVDLTDFIRTQEEPTISTAQYAQYKVMQKAAQHVTVLLDGQGADEMLTGYYPYFLVYLRQLKRQGRWLKLVGEVIRSSDILLRAVRFRILDALQLKHKVTMGQLLRDDFVSAYVAETYGATPDNLRLRFIEDIFKNSLPSLLRYEDRNSMRFSLEGRVPFLDKEVTKYLFSLSDEAIILNGWNKRIVRDALRGLLPPIVQNRRNKVGFTTPEVEWFKQLSDHFKSIFMSESFASRPYFNQRVVLDEFNSFINNRSKADSLLFWRIINIELWLREFIDPKDGRGAAQPHDLGKPEKIDIAVKGFAYRRYPLRSETVAPSEDFAAFATPHLSTFFAELANAPPEHKAMLARPWTLFVNEKTLAITQGRTHFMWDIKPGLLARLLSRFVANNRSNTGLGNAWTMQLAVEEAGLPRILFAAAGGLLGKIVGHKGWFYQLAGSDVRAIDGPAEYSAYPSNVSATLPPKNASLTAEHIASAVKRSLGAELTANFRGVVIVDIGKTGCDVIGRNVVMSDDELEEIFADGLLAPHAEHTPLCVVFDKEE